MEFVLSLVKSKKTIDINTHSQLFSILKKFPPIKVNIYKDIVNLDNNNITTTRTNILTYKTQIINYRVSLTDKSTFSYEILRIHLTKEPRYMYIDIYRFEMEDPQYYYFLICENETLTDQFKMEENCRTNFKLNVDYEDFPELYDLLDNYLPTTGGFDHICDVRDSIDRMVCFDWITCDDDFFL
jgi:hypothetical protein